ncbi:MAG TPA: DUF488 domain-containing protein [Burkholderiales bacterium]|nr:DUF488 domain-containing protein [Burkholderiales bacterium]
MIYTVGHGARSAVAFVFLLQEARISTLVDVRAYPVSRRHPQFSRDALAAALAEAGINYQWEGKALGGMRTGGYAAHMATPLFTDAAGALIAASREQSVCIMCAETDPSDCHRSHISDWLVAQGERVLHLIKPGEEREHAARLF